MKQRKKSAASGVSNPLRPDASASASASSSNSNSNGTALRLLKPRRPSHVMLTLFALLIYASWSVHHYQFERLPVPLTAEQAGKRGFSEIEAMEHVEALTQVGPHPVGSDALDLALQYVRTAAEKVKNTSHWEVDVEVDYFHALPGVNRLRNGLFVGKSLIYADINHVVLRVSPKYLAEARDHAILVSSHIDSVSTTAGAGDCSSCIAVMLELARGISQRAHGFKSSVIFLFNTGEEEGLNGAHSFITQHPWSETVKIAVDLEAMGLGGPSGIFQAGPHPWAIENFALVAKYPSAQIISQDVFASGIIKSATDFQVYKEVGGLSGLDFAYSDKTAVYHTKNDKLELLKTGSLQHLGENMLAFLIQTASSSVLGKDTSFGDQENADHDSAIFFDILGTYMVVYRQGFANMLYNSVILQSVLIWSVSLLMGGYPAVISLALSCLGVVIMWILSLSFSVLVAFILPHVSSSAVPYVANPWLAVGLFGAPALLGALAGQHIGFLGLKAYLFTVYKKRGEALAHDFQVNLAQLEAERWLFKSGILQWLILLILGNYYKIGSSYLALVWLVSPAFAYGLLEATLSPGRSPRPLKIATLMLGLFVPVLVSSGSVIRLTGVLIGSAVRSDRNPGGIPEYLTNVIVSAFAAAVVCLMLVYLLSYVHLSGSKSSVILAACALFILSIAAIWTGMVPPYSEEVVRTVNVVHVVDSTGRYGERQEPLSYVSLFSSTPGALNQEIKHIGEGFDCSRNKSLDFVTFTVKYGCWTHEDSNSGWSQSDVPTLQVESDKVMEKRVTQVAIDTKIATRWALSINFEEIEDFEFTGDSHELVSMGDKSSKHGWHIIQFSGGKHAPTKFNLTLHWVTNHTRLSSRTGKSMEDKHILRLRTDIDRLTPKVERILMKLPPWCSLLGKSTVPHTLCFFADLPIGF